MAAAGSAVTSIETYEALSEIYLKLWQQLERVVRTDHWLEIREEKAADLQDKVRTAVEAMSPDPSSLLFSDYRNTQDLILRSPHTNTTEAAPFCEYLRDTGLRFAQIADAMLPQSLPGT